MNLSIIIPNYNSEKTIEKCITSIWNQNDSYEIIVIDDNSKDKSISLIRKYPIKIIQNEKHKGAAYSRNLGIKISKGEHILFIDSDVYLKEGAIKKMLNSIKNVDITFPKILYKNGKIMYPCSKREKKYPLLTTCFMIKRNSLTKLDSLFDEKYGTYNEDCDFFLRCYYFNLKAKYVSNAIAIHDHKNSLNLEERFYLENKNILYGIIKFKKIRKKVDINHPFKISVLFKNFICALFNFNWFDWSHYNRNSSFFYKISLLLKRHKKITQRSRLILVFLLLKSILINLKELPSIIKLNINLVKSYEYKSSFRIN